MRWSNLGKAARASRAGALTAMFVQRCGLLWCIWPHDHRRHSHTHHPLLPPLTLDQAIAPLIAPANATLTHMAATSVLPASQSLPKMSGPAQKTTLLVTTFPGLDLPRTLSIPIETDARVRDALAAVHARLPSDVGRSLIVSTTSGKLLRASDDAPVTTLCSTQATDFLPLRITGRLCGGKGGFGSQLRAAGGRMSSRKNRDQRNQNGSNRNLDGRRLRTVDEAKRLAEYLATKPEMEQKEKDERRKRWEDVVAAAEATEAKIKSGKMGSNQGRLDAEYVESKEAAEEKVREAVAKAMREQMLVDGPTGSESDEDDEAGSGSGEDRDESSQSPDEAAGPSKKEAAGRSFFGWDEDDEYSSSEDEGTDEKSLPAEPAVEGKGKGKAT